MPKLDSSVFTVDLKAGVPGRYNFGYIDPNAYTANITFVPVDSSRVTRDEPHRRTQPVRDHLRTP
ncbi:Aspartic protease pepA [Madurella mycetomatis]|uniref:Aspartic protease pepA n=1 Tax=Madurella mycetomatis TaxID=100816 RepID=A0A175WGR9_9PEZI|nr:Aspartic protease pepA [Madurella mycetomatis]